MVSNNYAAYLFHQGTNFMAYKYLGAHRVGERYVFRVWAPGAREVYLIGSFNGWRISCPMERITEGGVWEVYTDAAEGDVYKYRIISAGGVCDKADPYATRFECPPATASIVCDDDISGFQWRDENWMIYRKRVMGNGGFRSAPINIYELHIESWKKHQDGTPLSYYELARELAPYVKQMGYTHVELMPVMEHPFSPSWGYQICGYFAPTARFGSPRDFMEFVDYMHRAGVGVILDWVPGHFPKDAHGLYEFDGTPLYEYQRADKIEHKGWGTRRFDVGRNEVKSFLVSNADFWASVYHVDGLRVDAVASMLYLDYDREPGEWTPNEYGDNRCLEAVEFFKKLNSHMTGSFGDFLMIAEESSAWERVTGEDNGGLGFSFKWNMGWMNDSLDYISLDPYFRKFYHNKLTFSLAYAFCESFVLPISHDEVVHGKRSLIDKMSGGYEQKFATARAFALFMMTHPGKKISFMGNEIGQFCEWNCDGQIEWFLLDYEMHARYQLYHAELNRFYLSRRELWESDGGWEGFWWIDPDNGEMSVYSYIRCSPGGGELIVILNFTPVYRENFTLGVPGGERLFELFNSDDERYGGGGRLNSHIASPSAPGANSLPFAVTLKLPPLGGIILGTEERKHD